MEAVSAMGAPEASLPLLRLSAWRRWWQSPAGLAFVPIVLVLVITYRIFVTGSITGVPTMPTSGWMSWLPMSSEVGQVSPEGIRFLDQYVTHALASASNA